MDTYIIYVKGHPASEAAAREALASFNGHHGWEPILFEGLTPKTLEAWERSMGWTFRPKPHSRANSFAEREPWHYPAKKACSMNHYILYKQCIEDGAPIAIVEHDVKCVGDWNNTEFSEVLVMNLKSALQQGALNEILKLNQELAEKGPPEGIHPYRLNGLNYRRNPACPEAVIAPGSAAIAVTPSGAKKLVDIYERQGWEQSDFILNTGFVAMETIGPELFSWNGHKLSLSYGKGL